MSADPDKIQHIVQADKPETIEDMCSPLQATAYNAKHGFDHREDKSYEEVTAPLRKQLNNDTVFKAAPLRVARHRNKVQDLRFTDKYLPGKQGSTRPRPSTFPLQS